MKKNYAQQNLKAKLCLVLVFSFLFLSFIPAKANIYFFTNTYSGIQEVPANGSPGKGVITGTYNDITHELSYTIVFSGLQATTIAAHLHAPAPPGVNAPVIVPHVGFPTGVTSGIYSHTDVLTATQETALLAGQVYANIHSTLFPGGEIRTQLALMQLLANLYPFTARYMGSNEVPPNNSPAIGVISGTYNSITNTIAYTVFFSGLQANAVAAHFHAPAPPGVNAPVIVPYVGFPTGVTSGLYTHTDVFTDAQEASLMQGLMYSNIHSTLFPGGEIRTQVILGTPGTCTSPTFLNDKTIVLDASQCGGDGNISIIPLSGTAPFMYSINGGTTYVAGANNGHTFQELPAGTYQLRLKDGKGCESAVVTREIKTVYPCPKCTPPTFLNNQQIVLDASCKGGDGSISIIPTSGTAPFMYSIDGGTTYVSGPNAGYTFQNLSAGMYQLRLKDSKGCESAVVSRQVKANAFGPCVIVSTNPRLRSTRDVDAAEVQAYPNPSQGQFQVQLRRFGAERVQVQILDARGSIVEQRQVNASETSLVNVNLSGKAKGLYLLRVVSDKGVQTTKINIQ